MIDTSPNGQLDRLAQDVAYIKMELTKLNKRLDESDTFTLKILHTLKRGEETFDLRIARSQYNLFAGLAHSLEHSIEDFTSRLQARQRGFEVHVVDGKTVLENSDTIQVARVTEDTYDYSPAATPDEINNVGTEPFTKYFNEHPEVFGDRKVILVNILTEQLPEVPVDV
ncbi:hypothetical protein ST201phi2-1p119 [Pseudomonas phage 201phi2-1]|uniref:Uncharacterized protein n=1 Tax=Pseudomonas phage 201phi2-1 TaxID=198110 RepID=B3FIY2_BP201|nr:hypothetical protein ST201phi2-1p119 [Pseudomonas phage 201phi2-1]ABY62951.1 hypothetical protein 201phi2-1p119 [Pseudomonas phage 201phi2-1]